MKKPDRLTLYRINNGFLIKCSDGLFVFESITPYDDGYDAINIKETLWHVNNWLGDSRDNRYSAERVHVSIQPGDKSEASQPEEKTINRIQFANLYSHSSGKLFYGSTFNTKSEAQDAIVQIPNFIKTVKLTEEDA